MFVILYINVYYTSMELSTLIAFVAVAKERNISAAARVIHVTQPAVSIRIRKLEESVGEKLFERSGRGVALTAAGIHLLPRAEEVLRASESFSSAAGELTGVRGGELLLGTTDVASIHVLPPIYRNFLHRFDRIDLSVRVEGTAPLLHALREGSIELAVVALPVEGDDLDTTEIARDRLTAILPGNHALAGRKRLRLEELASTPMITFKEDSVTRRMVSLEFDRRRITPVIAMEISSPEAIKKLVEVGLGFSFLSERFVRLEVTEGRLAAPSIIGVQLSRKIGLVRLKDRYFSPAARAFLETARLTDRRGADSS